MNLAHMSIFYPEVFEEDGGDLAFWITEQKLMIDSFGPLIIYLAICDPPFILALWVTLRTVAR